MTYEEYTFNELFNNISVPEDASIVYLNIVEFLKSRANDNTFTILEMDQLIQELDQAQTLLSRIQQTSITTADNETSISKKNNIIMQHLNKKLSVAKDLAMEFVIQDEKPKSGHLQWETVDRPILAKDFRDYMQLDLDILVQRIADLHFYYQLNNATIQQDIAPLRKFMENNTAYPFWATNMGQKNLDAPWKTFIDAYQVVYGNLSMPMLQSMENLLCDKTNNKVTLHRLILALCKYNNQFPFPTDIPHNNTTLTNNITDWSQKDNAITEEKRMALTKVAMDLVEKFSEAEMRNHLVTVYDWFSDYDVKNKEAVKERANEWGVLMKEKRDFIAENKQAYIQENHEHADRIDQARRAIYFFYEQFVTVWRVGEITRHVLSSIHFPGKGRINDFLQLVAPLDQANYYIVMEKGRGSSSIMDYRPKVYDFMEKYLSILEQQSMERAEYINGLI